MKTDAKLTDVAPFIGKIMDDVVKHISFGVGCVNDTPIDHELFDDEAWKISVVKPLKQKAAALRRLWSKCGGPPRVGWLRRQQLAMSIAHCKRGTWPSSFNALWTAAVDKYSNRPRRVKLRSKQGGRCWPSTCGRRLGKPMPQPFHAASGYASLDSLRIRVESKPDVFSAKNSPR